MFDDEIQIRRAATQIRDYRLDAVIACKPENACYLANYYNQDQFMAARFNEIPFFPVLCADGRAFAVAFPGSRREFAHTSWIADVIECVDNTSRSVLECLGVALKAIGLDGARVGLDLNYGTWQLVEHLQRCLPRMELVNADSLFNRWRAVKGERERALLLGSLRALEDGIRSASENFSFSWTIADVARQIMKTVIERGVTPVFFSPTKYGADWGAKTNPTARVAPLLPGRCFDVDMVAACQGYHADIWWAAVVGAASDGQKERFLMRQKAKRAIVSSIKPGMSCAEAFRRCQTALDEMPYREWWCVHGIGLEIHEPPRIGSSLGKFLSDPAEEVGFPVGCMICVELGAGVEEMWLMTEAGLSRLSAMPEQLGEI